MSSISRKYRLCVAAIMLLLITPLVFASGAIPAGSQRMRWRSNKIKLAVSTSLNVSNPYIKYGTDVVGAVRRSVETWKSVVDIDFVVESSDRETVSPMGTSGDGINLLTISAAPENVRLFGGADSSLAAKTRVFFNRRNQITEADIILNPFQQFSADGSYGTFDLEGTLTHEIGHLLGLRHSNVVGSIMYENAPLNGVFGSVGIEHSDLSADDIAAIRDLYSVNDDSECCATISGKLIAPAKTIGSLEIWAEDSPSGEVAGHADALRDGTFRIGGLREGNYRLFARYLGRSTSWSIIDLGEVYLTAGEVTQISRRVVRQPREFSVTALGVNGILGDAAVPLRVGGNYTLYLAGVGLSADSIRIGFNTPYVNVTADSIENVDYGEGITVLKVHVNINANASPGSYTVFASKRDGSVDGVVGGITLIDNIRK